MKLPAGQYQFWWLMRTGCLPCPTLRSNKTNYGYILIHGPRTRINQKRILDVDWRSPDRPRGYEKSIQELEHRIVMEEWLCRLLLPEEEIHHINGDRADNRRENLLLCSRSEHMSVDNRMVRISALARSPETRAKMSASTKAGWDNGRYRNRENFGFSGRHHTPETKALLSAHHRTKNWRSVREILNLAQEITKREEKS